MSARKRAELIGAARTAHVSWDDLRDRRTQRATWARFTRELARAPSNRPRWGWFYGLSLAGAAVLAALLWFRWPLSPPPLAAAAMASVAGDEQRVPFDEGSQGFLSADAELETVPATPGRYEVAQRKGKVRYDIRHDPQREFVVRVADVTVTVLGTQFSVDLRDSLVSVRVDRGRVRVFDGQRATELVTGESIEVRAFYAQGPDLDSIQAVPPTEPDATSHHGTDAQGPSPRPISVDDLLARADAARAAGHGGEAADLLRTVIARRPSAAQTSNAEFMLARVERGRGRHAAAAQAFEQCAALGGTLASEALAEAAASWLSAGDRARASNAAARYVQSYAHGPQAEKMRVIAK